MTKCDCNIGKASCVPVTLAVTLQGIRSLWTKNRVFLTSASAPHQNLNLRTKWESIASRYWDRSDHFIMIASLRRRDWNSVRERDGDRSSSPTPHPALLAIGGLSRAVLHLMREYVRVLEHSGVSDEMAANRMVHEFVAPIAIKTPLLYPTLSPSKCSTLKKKVY
ncbi:Gem-associated protein 7 [Frankliniella fusca]|uniref:Gem-associated protein 7 n=1 Tax=Frankliniella fusca TaxID=407009 RepID=A0AAE1LCI6_9NEOP|nr:Gem-associated protein 7 [Frankliniella fusca]